MNKNHQPNTSPQESISLMEPMIFSSRSSRRDQLMDLIVEIREKSEKLQLSIPVGLQQPLINFTRKVNSYFTNLIEGYKASLNEIEATLCGAPAPKDSLKLDLSVAVAHVKLHEWLDQSSLHGKVTTINIIQEIHRKFYEKLSHSALELQYPNSDKIETIIPGEFRHNLVEVGGYVAVHPNAIQNFMKRFEQVYSILDSTEILLSLAAIHHRFLWIHPFLDGNGRVARLMTQKILQDSLNCDAIWSLSRGLAQQKQNYMNHLVQCDMQRRNDLDGVGNLSEEAMLKFTQFMYDTCLNQIQFILDCVAKKNITKQIQHWFEEKRQTETLPIGSLEIIMLLLNLGELTKSEIIRHTGISEQTVKSITDALENTGVITIDSNKNLCGIQITADIARYWFPDLISS